MQSKHDAAHYPIQPKITEEDRADPDFPSYDAYRKSMTELLIEARSFKEWKASRSLDLDIEEYRSNPEYPLFLKWMQENQGGARPCPKGSFPNNFIFWLSGGRW